MTTPTQGIAFWVQLAPGQQLRGEGIGEHLMRLLAGVRDDGRYAPVVFAPFWAGPVIRDMLSSHGLLDNGVEIRLFGPWFLRLFASRSQRRLRRRDPLAWPVARRIVDLPAWTLFAVLALLAAPFAAVAWAVARVARRFTGPRVALIRERVQRLAHALVYAQMARAIDTDRKILGCIVPIGTWEFSRYIERKPILAQIPDIVFLEFPDQFRDNRDVPEIIEHLRFVAEHVNVVVCSSEHVKNWHLVQGLGVPADKVKVIDHAPIRKDKAFALHCFSLGVQPTRESAKAICRSFQRVSLAGADYARLLGGSAHWLVRAQNPSIWDRPTLYFPSQYRPYKNIERLISSVAMLRDVYNRDVTLLLTANLAGHAGVRSLIEKLHLHDRVIPLPRVTEEMHATLYAAADLVVAPSEFEGGFPFLFAEALSVNTPVVMARIPVTLAKVGSPMLERMTFDAEDTADFAACINRALDDEDLLGAQKKLHKEIFATRTWTTVAGNYIEALKASKPS